MNNTTLPPVMDKTYKRALELLNARRRNGRPVVNSFGDYPDLNRMPSMERGSDFKGTPSISGMKQWLGELGHTPADINGLNVIHVAGTKGKGSTCAFLASLLKVHGKRTGFPGKVGLYTSPHLIYPEERIRINMEPLQRDLFAKYVFEVENLLSNSNQESTPRPRYLQMYTLLAFHVFLKQGVDAAILETHHGGEYDSTNVVEKPLVTCVTTLGLDHVKQLGSSIESIAWHKSGIFKPGATAFSAPQQAIAMEVLKRRASEKGAKSIEFVDPHALPRNKLQLKPEVQLTNCAIALGAAQSLLSQTCTQPGSELTAEDITQGIEQFHWPGRFQLVIKDQNQWFLDSAHNEMSVGIAAEWFVASSNQIQTTPPMARVLIFSLHTDQRDVAPVFERLATYLKVAGIGCAIFTTYKQDQDLKCDSQTASQPEDPILPEHQIYAEIWKRHQPDSEIIFKPTIREALEAAKGFDHGHTGVQTLITGSQHLVGGALALIQENPHS